MKMTRTDKALFGSAGLVAISLMGVIGFSIKEVVKQFPMTRAQNVAYRAFNLTEEEVSADWTMPKVCAYKNTHDVSFVFNNATETQLIAFNNILKKEGGLCVDSVSILEESGDNSSDYAKVFDNVWTYDQALAVSKLSIDDALSQRFTNGELVAINFGASIEQVRSNEWNDATSFLIQKGFDVEQVISLSEEGVQDLYMCALTNMYSSSFDNRIFARNCDFTIEPPYTASIHSKFSSVEDVMISMSGCEYEDIFPASRCDHLAGLITNAFFGC